MPTRGKDKIEQPHVERQATLLSRCSDVIMLCHISAYLAPSWGHFKRTRANANGNVEYEKK